jgi:hypothetical protein
MKLCNMFPIYGVGKSLESLQLSRDVCHNTDVTLEQKLYYIDSVYINISIANNSESLNAWQGSNCVSCSLKLNPCRTMHKCYHATVSGFRPGRFLRCAENATMIRARRASEPPSDATVVRVWLVDHLSMSRQRGLPHRESTRA